MIFVSNEVEKFGGIQDFSLKEKNWLGTVHLKSGRGAGRFGGEGHKIFNIVFGGV